MQNNKSGFKLIHPSCTDVKTVLSLSTPERMLITTAAKGRTNTMTASYALFGVLFGKPVAEIFVRPQRFTFSLLEESSKLSLCFLPERIKDALRICGSKSGRNTDKFKESDLTCMHFGNVPYVGESESVFICKKLYSDFFKRDCFASQEPLVNYSAGDFHKRYIYEIEKILTRK